MCACEAIGSNDTLVLLGDPRQDESLVHFYGLEQEGIVCLQGTHARTHLHTQGHVRTNIHAHTGTITGTHMLTRTHTGTDMWLQESRQETWHIWFTEQIHNQVIMYSHFQPDQELLISTGT